MSVALPFADSTQRPSFPGENVHVSPAFEQVAGGSATLALSETQPANRRGAAAIHMTAMGPRRERTNGRGDIAPLYIFLLALAERTAIRKDGNDGIDGLACLLVPGPSRLL